MDWQEFLCMHLKSFVFTFFKERISSVVRIESMIIANKENRSQAAVFIDLTHYTSDAIAIVGIIMRTECNAIKAQYQQSVL